MSNLTSHAEVELRAAGLLDKDSDYDGELGKAVLDIVAMFAAQGHSGSSAAMTVDIAQRLMRFEPLTPLTNSPAEWYDHGGNLWQSTRKPSAFSSDGGRTYYDLDEQRTWLRRLMPWAVWTRLPKAVQYPMHRTVEAQR